MRRFFLKIGFFFLILIVGGIIIAMDGISLPADISLPIHQANPTVLPVQDVSHVQFPHVTMLLVQENSEGNSKRILSCGESVCQTLAQPKAALTEALYGEGGWYIYKEKENSENKKESRIVQLVRIGPDGEAKTIVEETPLVKPRGLFISPDGQKVAYFLDNKEQPELTEIWVYDASEGGTHLIAEKVTSHDVETNLRWNKSSTALWFVADSGEEDERKLEFVTVSAFKAGLKARFATLDMEDLLPIADHGVMDISPDQMSLAFHDVLFGGRSKLVAVQDGGEAHYHSIDGTIVYIQWIENNALIYALQQGSEFSFWRVDQNGHVPIARFAGVLQSAQADPVGSYISFISYAKSDNLVSYIVDTKTGVSKTLATVPVFGGITHLVQIKTTQEAAGTPQITQNLNDAQLTAFVQNHINEIVPTGKPVIERIIVTSEKNAVYVDYRSDDDELHRILVLVQDAINPEWKIEAEYQSISTEWQRVTNRGIPDPKPLRLYEWEQSVEQWILKTTYE